jgi:hypothetical protein
MGPESIPGRTTSSERATPSRWRQVALVQPVHFVFEVGQPLISAAAGGHVDHLAGPLAGLARLAGPPGPQCGRSYSPPRGRSQTGRAEPWRGPGRPGPTPRCRGEAVVASPICSGWLELGWPDLAARLKQAAVEPAGSGLHDHSPPQISVASGLLKRHHEPPSTLRRPFDLTGSQHAATSTVAAVGGGDGIGCQRGSDQGNP